MQCIRVKLDINTRSIKMQYISRAAQPNPTSRFDSFLRIITRDALIENSLLLTSINLKTYHLKPNRDNFVRLQYTY